MYGRRHSALSVWLLWLLVSSAIAAAPATRPLDFSYRVLGTAFAIGVVFDDGREVFIQPVDPTLAAKLHIDDAPYAVQGPYLVVRGLTNRVTVNLDGIRGKAVSIEYTGATRAETVARECTIRARETGLRATVQFETGSVRTEPGALDQVSRMLAHSRDTERVTLVAYADRPESALAKRRSARVRELLVAGGITVDVIEQRVRSPAASSLDVIVMRRSVDGCDASLLAKSVGRVAHGSEGFLTTSTAVVQNASMTNAGSIARTAPTSATVSGTAVAPPSLGAIAVTSAPTSASKTAESTAAVPAASADVLADVSRVHAAMAPALEQAISANRELARPVSDDERRKAVQQIMQLAAQGRITDQIAAALVVAAARAPAPALSATQMHAALAVTSPAPALLSPTALLPRAAPAAQGEGAGEAPIGATAPSEKPRERASAPLRLMFLPNTTVQATLRTFLHGQGLDVEFRAMPLLMVEEVAEVNGADVREVLRKALVRLGLRGEIQGNRLLVVELAN
ncbi:MAG: hypothetical protein H7125_10520 [Proteobacteria bacterium]|nr:hypothetical protein [Burkholderiales bacterium]